MCLTSDIYERTKSCKECGHNKHSTKLAIDNLLAENKKLKESNSIYRAGLIEVWRYGNDVAKRRKGKQMSWYEVKFIIAGDALEKGDRALKEGD